MTSSELTKLIEGLIVIGGIAAVVYAVFKNQTVKQTITSQKELIETLSAQVTELRTLHMENEKSIARLAGQVEVYKELPLADLATSMKEIANTQQQILKELKKGR